MGFGLIDLLDTLSVFYRPEKMLKRNFLVVCYILKRIMSYYIIAAAPREDNPRLRDVGEDN